MGFGLDFEKLLVLGLIAVLLIGPERLPHYAEQFAKLVRRGGELLRDTKSRVEEEMGPEVADVDWRKLDPRQYDPRRIIRDANRPAGVVVSMPSVRLRNSTPRPFKAPAKSTSCPTVRPRRSSFQTTKTSFSLAKLRASANALRSTRAPDAASEKIRSQPACLSASIGRSRFCSAVETRA